MGRPRKWPKSFTAKKRMQAANQALADSGGARKSLRLSATANIALTRMLARQRPHVTMNALIEDLIIRADRELELRRRHERRTTVERNIDPGQEKRKANARRKGQRRLAHKHHDRN